MTFMILYSDLAAGIHLFVTSATGLVYVEVELHIVIVMTLI